MEGKGLERFFKNFKPKEEKVTPTGVIKPRSDSSYEPKSGGRYSKEVSWNFVETQARIDASKTIPELQHFIEELSKAEGGKGYLFAESVEELNGALGRYAEDPTPANLESISLMAGLRERAREIMTRKE